MKVKLTRQDLYELVWSDSLLSLSKKYKISDVGLRKMCRRMEVPVPKIGYWAKIQAGRSLARKPLPAKYSGQNEVALELREPGSGGTTGFHSALTVLHQEILANTSLPLILSNRLSTKEDLIAKAKENLTEKRYRPSGGLISSSSNILDITVAPRNLMRALRIMAGLIRLLKARGHQVVVDHTRTYCLVQGQQIQLIFRERLEKDLQETGVEPVYKPSGVLSIQIKCDGKTSEARDGKVLLEEQLSKILAKIELRGIEARIEEERRERIRMEYETQERLRRERREKEDKELAEFKALVLKASRWKKATVVREFIAAVGESGPASENLKNWIQWAEAKCDWYDPRVEAVDELLSNVDRDTLERRRVYSW